jgi:NDP-sugar pyrophosphorylase family protein
VVGGGSVVGGNVVVGGSVVGGRVVVGGSVVGGNVVVVGSVVGGKVVVVGGSVVVPGSVVGTGVVLVVFVVGGGEAWAWAGATIDSITGFRQAEGKASATATPPMTTCRTCLRLCCCSSIMDCAPMWKVRANINGRRRR